MADLLDRLRQLVGDNSATDSHQSEQRLARAVLLVEVARADFADDERERQVVLRQLQDSCGLSATESSALLAEAEQRATEDVSLHRHIAALNQLPPSHKREIMQGLWEVANADGEIHAYEEHLLRRLADLLHVSQADYVQTRLAVTER